MKSTSHLVLFYLRELCEQWRLQEYFLGWSLRNLNYTKFNKKIIWIYQRYQKKKEKKKEALQVFSTYKVKKKKLTDKR